MTAIAITPTAPIAVTSACRVDVTDAEVNDPTTYNADNYPTETADVYYLSFEKSGADTGKSQAFQPAADGSFTFNSYIFPEAGDWTVHLRKVSDDSSVANLPVTVS